jgi:peptide/nickel transport system substrate-binding protein
MKKLKRIITAGLCLIALLVLFACGGGNANDNGGGAEDAAPIADKSVTIGLTTGPVHTIPIEYIDDVTTWFTQIMYLPLMALDEDGVYKPQLAESVTTSDYKSFTVTLDADAVWSDGIPVTADDVVFTANVIANPQTQSVLASFITILEGVNEAGLIPDGAGQISGVKKADERTVIFTTKEVTGMDVFNDILSRRLSPIPSHIFENSDLSSILQSAEFVSPTVINGPYKLLSFEKGISAEFIANEMYFMGAPKINKLNFKIVESANLTAELRSGTIDMNSPYGVIPTTDYDTVKNMETLTAIDGKMLNMRYLYINNAAIPDVRVRRAMSLAIDREQIIESCFPGYGEVTVMPFPNDFPYLDKSLSVPRYDPDEARRLTEEAGWDTSKALKLTSYNLPQVSQIIAQNLSDAGIPVEIDEVDWGTLSDKLFAVEYDLILIGDTFTSTNTVSNLLFLYAEGSNYNSYVNDELAALVNKVPTLTAEADIADNYAKIQAIAAEETPSPSLYCTSRLLALNNRVTNGGPKTFGMFIDVHNWDVK